MTLYDMIPGFRYLAGDGGGYDYVKCIAIHPGGVGTPYEKANLSCDVVEVEFEENKKRGFWFETEGFSRLYVESANP